VHDFTRFAAKNPYKDALKNIVDVAKKVGSKGFDNLQVSEVEELIVEHDNELTDEDLEELVKSADKEEEDGDEEAVPSEPKGNTIDNLAEIVHRV